MRINVIKKGLANFFYFAIKLINPIVKRNIRERGFNYFFQSMIRIMFNLDKFLLLIDNYYNFWTWFYKTFKSSRIFKFQRTEYKYFYHRYSITWNNERSVEIPIIWKIVEKYKNKHILEIGNVLSHYFHVNHDIVDKYEESNNVINQDVVDFKPLRKYDLIISISTLEHVGWDETPRDPLKILRAVENLKNLLNPKGKIIVTLPIGQNPILDKYLDTNKLNFTEQFCLKRKTKNNKWKEVNWKKISNVKYGTFTRYSATGLLIGIIKKQRNPL